MEQGFLLYQHHNGPCPYLSRGEWITQAFQAEIIDPLFYEGLISSGFRRSGTIFYQNQCPDCSLCMPIRLDIQRFRPSKSQRRVLRKNHDVTIIRHPAFFDVADFHLYRKYVLHRHPSSSAPTQEGYFQFLIDSPVSTEIMRYYVEERLVGLGWIDLLSHSLSSVYFAFDPSYSSRSLGTFSILQQVLLGRELQKAWLHLGFWVKNCQKMSYKSRFHPCQILTDGIWNESIS